MATTLNITRDQPIRVSSSIDADETRRLIAILGIRVGAQFANLTAIALALGVKLDADPASPIRSDVKAHTGIANRDNGLTISLLGLPVANLQDGWIVLESGNGETQRISLRAIAYGPYFPGIHMLESLKDPFNGLEVDPYYGGNPVSDGIVASWNGNSLNATRNDVHWLLGSVATNPVPKAIYWLRQYVVWFSAAVRSGASRSQG